MISLTDQAIDIAAVIQSVQAADCGGICSFVGTVRNHSKGKSVIRLEYEAYPEMALHKLRQVATETSQKWPVRLISIVHRTGTLQIGDAAVAIAVGCAHRAEAFAACQYTIDRIKEIVPIWKKEFSADGEVWVSPTP